MAFKIYTRTGDKGKTALIGGTKVPKSNIRIESYGTVDELNSFIGLLNDQLTAAMGADTTTPLPNVGDAEAVKPLANLRDADTTMPLPNVGDAETTMPLSNVMDAEAVKPLATVQALLREIQDRLFTIGSSLACDPEQETRLKIPDLKATDISLLEEEIDRMNLVLPEMKTFLLPGGHVVVSAAHIARCVCRRAERICVEMQEKELFIEPLVIQYLNRLSDYLFVLARWVGQALRVQEIPWKPRVNS